MKFKLPAWGKPDKGTDAEAAISSRLDARYSIPLLSMYRTERQVGIDGQRHAIDEMTRISPSQGLWLYELCLSTKPTQTLEIGMAYGYSTLFFLAALDKNQCGHHTAIDPFQRTSWHGIGLAHVQAVIPDSGQAFRLIESRSDQSSVDLTRANSSFEVIYIDGNHRFDDVLVDFYLYAPLCAMRGHIVLDDMWMPSIQTVADFVRTNRTDFKEIPTEVANICVFQKIGDDTRDWRHFRSFHVAPDSD